jgi:hypothetical protein
MLPIWYLVHGGDDTTRRLRFLRKTNCTRRHDGLAYLLLGTRSNCSWLRTMEHALRAPIYDATTNSASLRALGAGESCRRRRPVHPVNIFLYKNLIVHKYFSTFSRDIKQPIRAILVKSLLPARISILNFQNLGTIAYYFVADWIVFQ